MQSEYLPFDAGREPISRLDRMTPRYTLYPAAEHFVEAFGPDAYCSWARKRNVGAVQRALALYVHVPSGAAGFRAENKVTMRHGPSAEQYMAYLVREIALQAPLFRRDPVARQMHWAGSPATFFSTAQLQGLLALLRRHFAFAAEGEYSIEIDAGSANGNAVTALREAGLNRLHLRVLDADPLAQRATNRAHSEERLFALVAAARSAGFRSVSINLAYGVSWQNLFALNRSLARVIAAGPDRIALRCCTPLPECCAAQRRINDAVLPSPETEQELLALASQCLTGAGYAHIGVDHFAKPNDELTVAQRQGRLHRNIHGYSAQPACDIVGLGVSAIGSIGPTYSQNYRDLARYYGSLDGGVLPIMRGVELTLDDLARRAVIQTLLCRFTLSKQAIEIAYLIDFDRYFAAELRQLRQFARRGLLELEARWISVAPECRLLTPNVCAVFDKYLRHSRGAGRYLQRT